MNEDKAKEKEIRRSNSKEASELTSKENTAPLSTQDVSSASSVKIKKSSNIFSTLVRKARRKKGGNKNDGVKNGHVSSQNLSCSSTMSLATHMEEEVELSCQNYEKRCNQHQKVLWESHGICSETNTSNDDFAQTNLNQQRNQYEVGGNKEAAPEYSNEGFQEEIIFSSFIKFQKPVLKVTYADALQYLQEVINHFHESESHLIDLLLRYITDPSLQKDMMNAVSNHTKLQWEAERRSCSLANDIWIQQLEIGRAQEKILQNTLHSLIKQNRQLQLENESLYRKNEKTNKLLKGYVDHKSRYQECDTQVDSILRHNEKLQIKLESVFKKTESLEIELQMFQKQNDSIEEQLRNSTLKIQNLKVTLHRMKTDYEIEQVSLNFKLESKEQVVKEVFEMGDIVMEDLDSLKRQLKNLPFSLNWTKFKVRSNCLTDLIHVCRLCINELSKELINIYTEITLKDKDIITLRETNKNLHENLKKSIAELNVFSKKIQDIRSVTDEKLSLEQRCQILENELKSSEEKAEKLKIQYESEKANLLQHFVGNDKHIKELEEKDKMIEQTKLFVTNITSENYSLKNEIVVLNRIIEETGAGDVVREIEHTHEELEFAKKELGKLTNENAQLKIQAETARNENIALITNQEITYKTLQRQVKELERLNEDNQNLRQKVETEHQTVLSLQNERMKYLDEKNVLKSIIQHLKSELAKIRQLEENLSNVTKEASKLELMAEYNKQHSDKLKQEVLERDNTITQLKTSMQKLNELQMQHAKEKLSLCYELNEVSQLKEKLNEVLNTEVKKNAELGQSKEAIVKSVSSQIQKIEEKQRNERTALRILLRDLKNITEEKENISKEKYKLQIEIEQLKIKLSDHDEKYESITKELTKKTEEVKELRKEIDSYEKKHKEFNYKLENETSKYELNVRQLKKLIEQLRDEKKHLEHSKEYLKNNVEKLYKDLNQSRASEKSTADTLSQIKQQQEEAKQLLKEQTHTTKEFLKEKEKFIEENHQLITEKNSVLKENDCLNVLLDKVVNDFEKSIKTTEEKEKLFKHELDEAREILNNYGKEIQELKQIVENKDLKLEELKKIEKMDEQQEKRYNKLKEEMSQLEKECISLKEGKREVEVQLTDLKDEYNKLAIHITNLEKESDVLESQLKIVLNQKEEDYIFYKKHIAEISRSGEEVKNQNQKEINKLRLQLQDVTAKLNNEKIAYETLSQIHKDVSGKFMRSIKDLVDVKNSKQDVLEKIKEDRIYLENMENEKKELHIQVKRLTEILKKSNDELKEKNEENAIMQKNYTKALEKSASLERQIKQTEMEHNQEYQNILSKAKENGTSQVEIEKLKAEIEEHLTTIHRLKMEIADFQKQITLLEIERSEMYLKLQETEKKMDTERNLAEQLKNTQKLILAAVIQLRDGGKVDSSDCIHLLHMARSSQHISTESNKSEH